LYQTQDTSMTRAAAGESRPHEHIAAKGNPTSNIGVRWTIGDVSTEGFEALQLSVLGAHKVFGTSAAYAICVNSIPITSAQEKTGELPPDVRWIDATDLFPGWLRAYFDDGMAEGVGWKFAPLRMFPERYEIALDNDCILWELPQAIRAVLDTDPQPCVLAEDVRACLGQFAELCGPEPRNTGIRGTPAHFDLQSALQAALRRCKCRLRSETDEQGLQVAALSAKNPPLVVRTEEVTICSPFPPHSKELGRCGAHFVGLNARSLPWEYYGQPASKVRRTHWYELREAVFEHVV
jgi:hypothetical protein